MMLRDLITALEARNLDTPVAHGFGRPHSYRGDYACLAFEPAKDTTVGAMLSAARSALGKTYTGYKGGEFVMGEYTDVYIAEYSRTGDAISEAMLVAMIDAPQEVARLRAVVEAAEKLETFYINRAWAMDAEEASLWAAFRSARRAAADR